MTNRDQTRNAGFTYRFTPPRNAVNDSDLDSSVLETEYRVSPLLLIYPARIEGRRRLIAETQSSEPPLMLLDARFPWALSVLPETFARSEAVALWSREPTVVEVADHIWETALSEGLIVPLSPASPQLQRYDQWAGYNWSEASIYQESTRDYPFLKMNDGLAPAEDESRMREYLAHTLPPSVYQEHDSLARIPLEKLPTPDKVDDFILALPPADIRGRLGLSVLFDACFGERGRVQFGVQGSFLHKSVPSGGARHPTEVFLAAFEGLGISPGLYHYNVLGHSLDLLRAGDHSEVLRGATFDLFDRLGEPPIGLLVFTALNERAMWRYRDARSWRAIPMDIGHAVMAFRQVSELLGLRSYTYQKFRDSVLSSCFGIRPLRQTALFVGTIV